jgi:hypothetical protein
LLAQRAAVHGLAELFDGSGEPVQVGAVRCQHPLQAVHSGEHFAVLIGIE